LTIFLLPRELTKAVGHEKVGVDFADDIGKARTVGREEDVFAANPGFLRRGKAKPQSAGTRS
jgi:hypothetical protein